MTTLNATYARRAMARLTTPDVAPTQGARPARYRWPRVSLPVPAAADSRGGRAVLSTGLRTGWLRLLDLAGLVAAATGGVALLGVLCR